MKKLVDQWETRQWKESSLRKSAGRGGEAVDDQGFITELKAFLGGWGLPDGRVSFQTQGLSDKAQTFFKPGYFAMRVGLDTTAGEKFNLPSSMIVTKGARTV